MAITITVEQKVATVTTSTPKEVTVVVSPVRTVSVTASEGLSRATADQLYAPIGGGVVDKTYRHVQGIPASTWVINHNLQKYPSYIALDSSGAQVLGDPTYASINQLILYFSAPFSGEAHIN